MDREKYIEFLENEGVKNQERSFNYGWYNGLAFGVPIGLFMSFIAMLIGLFVESYFKR